MEDIKKLGLKKEERINKTKDIELLFEKGDSFIAYPLRVILIQKDEERKDEPTSILISVPKKRLKRAVHRNRVKRLIRECYRLNKNMLTINECNNTTTPLSIAFVYVKNEIATFSEVEKGMLKALREIAKRCDKEQQ